MCRGQDRKIRIFGTNQTRSLIRHPTAGLLGLYVIRLYCTADGILLVTEWTKKKVLLLQSSTSIIRNVRKKSPSRSESLDYWHQDDDDDDDEGAKKDRPSSYKVTKA